MKELPSASQTRQPRPRRRKRGVRPTEPKARTGLFTPPGITRLARSKSFLDCREPVVVLPGSGAVALSLADVALGEPRHREDLLARIEVHHAHALGGAAHGRDAADARPQHLAAAGDEHDLVLVDHLRDAHHLAVARGGADRDHALAAA